MAGKNNGTNWPKRSQIYEVPALGEVKHPTCVAVLELVQQAAGLLQARIGADQAENPDEPTPQLRALSVGYGFEALRNRTGPFSHADARDLIHKAFAAGWQSRDFQGRIDGKEGQANVAAAPRPDPEKVADLDPSAAKRGRLKKSPKRRANLRRDARVG